MEKIPEKVKFVIEKLEDAGFEAFIVGGCVRDFIMKRMPNDWDIATNAHPEKIQEIFPDSLYENKFGTVTVRVLNSCHSEEYGAKRNDDEETPANKDAAIDALKHSAIQEVQITTYRIEHGYSDKRHPDQIEFANTIEKDLSRRDFTMNAIALPLILPSREVPPTQSWSALGGKDKEGSRQKKNIQIPTGSFTPLCSVQDDKNIIDPFHGLQDIKSELIRAVGSPEDRFDEDALRMMRAVRFSAQLDFKLEENTQNAIKKNAKWLERISKERIRDEFAKIILSNRPSEGIELLQELGLLHYIMPELEYGIGISQNLHHIYTVYQHLILSLKYCPSKKLSVRLAALLHDIAKPRAKQGSGISATFYNHDYLGAKFSRSILRRLKFSNEIIGKTSALVGSHMFFYDVDAVSESAVRRLVKKIGKENVKDLIDLRIADRLGSGVPKAKPYKIRHLEYMIDKVSQDPISVKMLKIKGDDIMNILETKPGVRIGAMLDVLLSEVLDDPSKNNREHLTKRIKEINQLDLNSIRALAKEKIEERKEEEDKTIKRRHWVK